MKNIIREETWSVIDQFFQEMPEAIGKLPTFQEALSESMRQGFQEGEQRGFQEGEQRGEQRMLIRQLRHKFSRVPKSIVQQIETTTDMEQLDNWLIQVISAKKLAEIDFNLPQ